MRNIRSGSPRRQQGFIQGAILFALGLLVVIIGAFSVANNNSSVNTDAERDRTNAAVVVKASVDIQTAVERALQDGHKLASLQPTASSVAAQDGPPVVAAVVGLFDADFRYGNVPTLPASATKDEAAATYAIVTQAFTGIGSTGADTLLQIKGLTLSVCRRAEAIANGTAYDPSAPGATPTNARAGCYNSAASGAAVYTFYRVLATS